MTVKHLLSKKSTGSGVGILLLMAACTFAPELPTSRAPAIADEWPSLLTAEQLAALQKAPQSEYPVSVADALAAKAAELRKRAAQMDQPILTNAERRQLEKRGKIPLEPLISNE